MNEGLESRTMRQATAADTYSEKWWRETKQMVNRGYNRLVIEGRIAPEPSMREIIKAEHRAIEQRLNHHEKTHN